MFHYYQAFWFSYLFWILRFLKFFLHNSYFFHKKFFSDMKIIISKNYSFYILWEIIHHNWNKFERSSKVIMLSSIWGYVLWKKLEISLFKKKIPLQFAYPFSSWISWFSSFQKFFLIHTLSAKGSRGGAWESQGRKVIESKTSKKWFSFENNFLHS